MQYLTQHHTTKNQNQQYRLVGGNSSRETPGPIPNPEAKPAYADGTATGRLWESKKPPTPNNTTTEIPQAREQPTTTSTVPGLLAYPAQQQGTAFSLLRNYLLIAGISAQIVLFVVNVN